MSDTSSGINRRAFGRIALFAAGGLAVGAAAASVVVTQVEQPAPPPAPPRRAFIEYRLPAAKQTHEVARVPGSQTALVTQMSNSVLVKLALDRDTEHVTDMRSFQMGSPTSELHGLAVSRAYPGMVWATLQRENRLLLLQVDRLDAAPTVVRSIDIAPPGFGPHQVNEIGDHVWAGLKYPSPQTGKYYVLAVDHARPSDQKLYECLPQPVFQAQEPASGIVYASQDASSSIMRIDHATGRTDQIPVPPQIGQNAVGLVRCDGPLAGVWGVLAGGPTGGTGAFYRIGADGQPAWFRLGSHLGQRSGLLHLADATNPGGPPALWLLATSLLSADSPDALVHVTFDAAVTRIVDEEVVALPTQNAMNHRVLPLDRTVVVSEWNTSTLAQLEYTGGVLGTWDTGQPAGTGMGHD